MVEFTGALSNPTEMLEWAAQEQHPLVRSITPDSLRSMFELDEGLVVIKVGNGVTRAKDAKGFRDLAEPILRRASSPTYFGIMDADHPEIRQWFMLPAKVPPKVIMLDLKVTCHRTGLTGVDPQVLLHRRLRHPLRLCLQADPRRYRRPKSREVDGKRVPEKYLPL